MGALSALISLAKIDDRDTSLRCALAFANLSCVSTVQWMMIDHGVHPILKMFSCEDNQLFVTKALAQFSCHVGSDHLMIDEYCASVFVMIGMVRSVQNPTKPVSAALRPFTTYSRRSPSPASAWRGWSEPSAASLRSTTSRQ